MSKYINNYSLHTKPLRDLLRKDTHFTWDENHKLAFQKIKESLILRYFDPNLEIVVSVDASMNGLGACLLQQNLPVFYASKRLTDSQSSQAQITKELQAVYFGLTKFHDFVFGRQVIVETDHKPLISLVNKPLNKIPARLQRIMLHIQRYDFKLIYKRGKELILADSLSRACNSSTANEEYERYNMRSHRI